MAADPSGGISHSSLVFIMCDLVQGALCHII